MYTSLSHLYDKMFSKLNDRYLDLIFKFIQDIDLPETASILEIACGTGTVALALAEKGYRLSASDLSSEMIKIAECKNTDHQVEFYQSNMLELDEQEKFDMVLCVLDGLTYLKNPEELEQVFEKVHQSLRPGGYFMFDLFCDNSVSIDLVHKEKHFTEFDDAKCIVFWEENQTGRNFHVKINIYEKLENHMYEDYYEEHFQRIFHSEEVMTAISNKFDIMKQESKYGRVIYYCKKV